MQSFIGLPSMVPKILRGPKDFPSGPLTLFRPGGVFRDPPKVSVHNSQSFSDNSLKFGDFS